MFKNLIYLKVFRDNEFSFYFMIVFIIIKDLIFDYNVFVVVNAFDDEIVIFYIDFKWFKDIESFIFMNIEMNIKSFIDVLYEFKHYSIIRINIDV